jgi:hypothetical protein
MSKYVDVYLLPIAEENVPNTKRWRRRLESYLANTAL